MAHGRSRALGPTFEGFVFDTNDALLLFEGVFRRQIPNVPRRLVPGEYRDLVKSGSIFIYEEYESGIKRWTDGRAWSPSRVLDNFLVYRESEKISPALERKKTLKRKISDSFEDALQSRKKRKDSAAAESPVIESSSSSKPSAEAASQKKASTAEEKELIKSLAGSFTDDSVCRDGGLIKKTMSVTINNLTYHMVSYYTIEDVKNKVLMRPSHDQGLQNLAIRPELYRQNFRQAVYLPNERAAGRATVVPRPRAPTATTSRPHSMILPASELYLSLAPGTQRIQLRQSSPPPPQTNSNPYETAEAQQPSNPYYQFNPRASYSSYQDDSAVRYQRPPVQWYPGWQPGHYYHANMPPPPAGALWNEPFQVAVQPAQYHPQHHPQQQPPQQPYPYQHLQHPYQPPGPQAAHGEGVVPGKAGYAVR